MEKKLNKCPQCGHEGCALIWSESYASSYISVNCRTCGFNSYLDTFFREQFPTIVVKVELREEQIGLFIRIKDSKQISVVRDAFSKFDPVFARNFRVEISTDEGHTACPFCYKSLEPAAYGMMICPDGHYTTTWLKYLGVYFKNMGYTVIGDIERNTLYIHNTVTKTITTGQFFKRKVAVAVTTHLATLILSSKKSPQNRVTRVIVVDWLTTDLNLREAFVGRLPKFENLEIVIKKVD